MAEVHYRVLAYRRGGALGDRLVMGLVHWDGELLRSAFDETRVGASRLSGEDSAVRGAVRSFRALAEKSAAGGEPQVEMFSTTLDDRFPVPSGVGSSLAWSEVKFAEPSRPEAHFESLRRQYGLVRTDRSEQDRMTREQLDQGLRELGERLRAKVEPEKLRVGAVAGGPLAFASPLSWRNGVWHHAIPVSFDTATTGEMHRRAFVATGHVVGGIAPNEKPVVVLAMTHSPEALAAVERFRAALRSAREDVALVAIGGASEDPFAELEQRIVEDVTADH